ncbi:hypothetical protein [Rhizobium alvei]|uniref:Flagellar FliJ protein n=1 Tax=Rhizobium alvei TaxID=1132659 RepID=A0ABT8YG68_9HYPH|nr:hypothetical protein [Rhizobium alvei]MDO6962586.1 hypothetical protein [Rhizobium alvei]
MAPQTRSEKLKRLVKVQRQIEQMAEIELANTTRARGEIQENLDAVVDAIGSLEPVHQIFASLYSNQIGRLTIRDQQLEGLQRTHEARIMREKAKADRLEENMKDARELENREAEDNAIYDIVDQRYMMIDDQD